MRIDSTKKLQFTARDRRIFGRIFLLISLGANFVSFNFCRAYFHILHDGVGNLSSAVDERGGFGKMTGLVPLLVAIAVIGGIVASRLDVARSLSKYSVLAAPLLYVTACVLVYYIVTSWRG